MSRKTHNITNAPISIRKMIIQSSMNRLVKAFCTAFELIVLVNLPRSWYLAILQPLLVLDLSVVSDTEVDEVWEAFTACLHVELKMLAGLSTLVLGASVGLLSSDNGQASPYIFVSGILPIIYTLEFASIAAFYSVCMKRIGRDSEAKRNFIKNSQRGMILRFSNVSHIIAAPFAWATWSIVSLMGFLVVYTLGLGSDTENPTTHLPLPLSVVTVIWFSWTVSYLTWCSYNFSQLSAKTDASSLPLTTMDAIPCFMGTVNMPQPYLPSTSKIVDGPQPPFPPPAPTSSCAPRRRPLRQLGGHLHRHCHH
ncbi:hypothetical protein ABKN59_002832 [Abortiporus biennis]